LRKPHPYDLVPNDRGYHFFTDLNYTYYVYFEQSTGYFEKSSKLNDVTYGFGFGCNHDLNDHKFDPRIEDTITHCINLFFAANPGCIIAYTCEGKDKYELLRFRLFGIWSFRHFSHYCEKLNYKTKLSDSWFCGSIIFTKANPYRDFITESFYKEFND
jgi:hypothetical protein